ncbi:c-type cytochrome [Anaeromyxobacter oryzisoli]|uniref:c-type cytochrome n=1 Tax=Anaeromyxobacter oryzisoli TaxID=2925408 RepID=UPI001F58B08E|nr:c-type cytochrome [Anaeromyxobacter sp. SG63]
MRAPIVLCAAALCAWTAARAAGPPSPLARAGERLFIGEDRLQNGGAPCLACHAFAGHGLAWSASFGPDLSDARARYDADALGALLADVQLPSMEPVYRGHALTPGERDDVVAFLLQAEAVPEVGSRRRLAIRAGAVALALLGAAWLVSRRRMPPARAALAARRAARGRSR